MANQVNLNNKISEVSLCNAKRIISESSKNTLIVEIIGDEIHDLNDFFSIIRKKFLLPEVTGWDSFEDWMTDLSWISEKEIIIIISNYKHFLKNKSEDKDIFFEVFSEDILPFWENMATQTIVGGEPKDFNVYLVI